MRRLIGVLMVVAAVQTAATAARSGRGSIRSRPRDAKTSQRVIILARRINVYRSLFPARAGSALLRILTPRGGIVRRFLGAFMLVVAVLTVAAAAPTTALAGSAQAVSKPPASGTFGIRLVDVPVDEADNPRAYRYIIDHLNPGTTIHRRVQIANLTPRAALVTVYPDAAIIHGGSFVGDAGQTPSDLTTWISMSRRSVALAPQTRAMVTLTIEVPRTASPGNLYGVIWAQETNLGKTSSGVNVIETNRVGVRIYLNIGPGGPPPVNFGITSIRGTRSARGQFMVVAQVNNTGGQAIDATGTLKLTDGPGGLSAGPYQEPGVTLAPGQSQPITVVLNKEMPHGSWLATIDETSGITQRSAAATIDFYPAPSRSLYLILGIALIVLLLFAAGLAAWLILRNRPSAPGAGHLDDVMPPRPPVRTLRAGAAEVTVLTMIVSPVSGSSTVAGGRRCAASCPGLWRPGWSRSGLDLL